MIPHTGAPKSPLGVAHRLPITAQPNDPLPCIAAEDAVIRIALIEDDNLMREWLGRSLTTRGYKVERFRRAEEALPTLCDDTPDAVVTDIRMPGMSGIELGRLLRTRGIDVPLVFMTADASESLGVDALEIGVRRLLRKPFSDLSELWAAVEDAVAESISNPNGDLAQTSHALRTPLTAIKMAFEGLVADRTLDPREQHLAEIAARNIERLSTAVEDHLTRLAVAETASTE
jgi:DNA-binding response OmpR family regulator